MMFKDLQFKPHPVDPTGQHAVHTFPNGWGVSVIAGGRYFYCDHSTFELAVMREDGGLHYANPVARGDVRGYLSPEEVDAVLSEVATWPASVGAVEALSREVH